MFKYVSISLRGLLTFYGLSNFVIFAVGRSYLRLDCLCRWKARIAPRSSGCSSRSLGCPSCSCGHCRQQPVGCQDIQWYCRCSGDCPRSRSCGSGPSSNRAGCGSFSGLENLGCSFRCSSSCSLRCSSGCSLGSPSCPDLQDSGSCGRSISSSSCHPLRRSLHSSLCCSCFGQVRGSLGLCTSSVGLLFARLVVKKRIHTLVQKP